MSGAIEKLTAALEANTAAINAMVKASGGKPVTAASTETKAAAGNKAAAGGKAAGGNKKKATTVDDIAAKFGAYLGVKDADERTERKANVKAIVDYFGAAKATEIDPENFDEALGYLQQYIDGEEPDFAGGGDEGDDEGALV